MKATPHDYITLPDYNITDVCKIFNCTSPTVYKLLNRGELKGYKVGASRRITRESVEALRSGKSAA